MPSRLLRPRRRLDTHVEDSSKLSVSPQLDKDALREGNADEVEGFDDGLFSHFEERGVVGWGKGRRGSELDLARVEGELARLSKEGKAANEETNTSCSSTTSPSTSQFDSTFVGRGA